MMVTDADGVILRVNRAFTRLTGYTENEVVGKTPALLKSGRQDNLFYQNMWATLKREHYWQGEMWNRHKDGNIFVERLTVTAAIAPDGNVTHYIGTYFDMTARMLAEGVLLKAGALQSAIFNSANFLTIATDAKGEIQIFSVGAERMLGYTAADVLNKITPADITDPQELIVRAKALSVEIGTPIAPGFEALVFKATRGIEDIYELTYIRKDGSRLPAVESVTALRDSQDVIIGYLLIGTDNTARKHIEEEQYKLDQRLRDQQFYSRSLFDSNIDALMTTNPSGIITDVNKQMEMLTGCSRVELIGAPFKNYFTDQERAETGIKRVLSEKKITDYELTARARDGKETVVSFNATPFYDRDRSLQGVFAAARDVTDRKRLNKELESAKSVAEKANLAKSDFLSRMSHELRTPLNAILGFAQLLEGGLPPPTSAQILRLQQITKAGWYLLDLLNEILYLAVIESGKLSLSPETISLAEVLHECQTMIEPQAQKKGIRINFLPFDPAWFANADRTRAKQVLINLISNAIKYNREQGTVEVECTSVTQERIRISVKDCGVGLPPEKLAQLFQPFNRLGQEAGAEEGTGIGLVVTKQLVELMGGTIGVKSTVGQGSTFWIELIRDVAPQIVAGNMLISDTASRAMESTAWRTLLYVEDNPANLMLVEQIIEGQPKISMLSARDGNHAVALARAHLPDVILMDINLPGISGFEALSILRKDPSTAHIPVVALSSNAMTFEIEKGLEAGFFRYLTKPFDVNELLNALNDAMIISDIESVDTNKKGIHDD
jgi:PAS domain S-box-containing protein